MLEHHLVVGRLASNAKQTCEHPGCVARPDQAIWWENKKGEMVSPTLDLCASHVRQAQLAAEL